MVLTPTPPCAVPFCFHSRRGCCCCFLANAIRLRPTEYAKSPQLFKDGVGSADVVQGQLDDVWLLGALAAAANHPAQLVRNLVVSPTDDGFAEHGLITFQFYKDGDWVPVTVDTRIPFGDPETVAFNAPIYGRCKDSNEAWLPLMEKALAKLHSNYELLHGGSVTEALADITGGVSQSFLMSTPRIKELVEDGRLWQHTMKGRTNVIPIIEARSRRFMKVPSLDATRIMLWVVSFLISSDRDAPRRISRRSWTNGYVTLNGTCRTRKWPNNGCSCCSRMREMALLVI